MKSFPRTIGFVITFAVLLATGGFYVLNVQAQSTPQEAAQISLQDISFSASPEVPGAFQDVTITVNSYLTDVNRAFFVWKKDGKTQLSATGADSFTFTTGDIGQKTIIDIAIALSSGETLQKRMVFNPAETNLIWEGADSYTPPFYRGRALPTSEGYIRVVAIPQINNSGTVANINNYVFRWVRNDLVETESSGFNKSALIFQQSYLNEEENIEVTGQDNTSGMTARGTITVPVFKPKVLLYARDPINGIDWDHELGAAYDVTNAEKTVLAIPYFFSPANPLSNQLKYTWSINDDEIQTPSIANMLTLKSGASKGVSKLTVRVENLIKLFLEAEKNITINLK